MKVVIIDGQGGRIGQLLTEVIVEEKLPCDVKRNIASRRCLIVQDDDIKKMR